MQNVGGRGRECKWRILKFLTEELGFQNTNSQKEKVSLSIVILEYME